MEFCIKMPESHHFHDEGGDDRLITQNNNNSTAIDQENDEHPSDQFSSEINKINDKSMGSTSASADSSSSYLQPSIIPNSDSDPYKSKWVTLNVGGKLFSTTISTLTNKEPNSMLARMFAPEQQMNPSQLDNNGAYLIDRSSQYFEPILNFLRHGLLIRDDGVSLQGILEEAKFFGIEGLIPYLEHLINGSPMDDAPLTRRDVINAIIQTNQKSELRFQGVNMAGADLSKLDLRNINFKFACLSGCKLSLSNLNYCCLERADLSHANLEGAQLLAVRGSCANMEGANLQGCNFEDPQGGHTCLEGVNLKGACLENSNMANVNLRVANLKDANLKNCNLRSAVLAGADLERCNLSGSDLQEANLRGANLRDAQLELMLTPLHMSQAIR